MGSCDREVFELLIPRGDVAGIQGEISRCVNLALGAVGGRAQSRTKNGIAQYSANNA